MTTPRVPPELARWFDAAASSTRPWLLDLARRQAARRRPADLLAQYERDRFVEPGVLDQRTIHRLDALALEAAPEYEAVLLSPVAPLGCCSAMAPTSQDRTVTTMRGSEVVSDPTNVLALECARRVRRASAPQRLCTVHQTLRAQPVPSRPGHARHFRLFALVDAGRALPEDGFEVAAITAQLGVFDRLFDAAERGLGCRFPRRRAVVCRVEAKRVLAERVVRRLAETLPHVAVGVADLNASYYDGVRVSFGADDVSGEHCALGDVGAFDWLAKLCGDRRLRFVAGGFGLQLVPLLFRD